MVIEDITSDSEAENTRSSNKAFESKNNSVKSDDVQIDNAVTKKFPAPQHEGETNWSQSKDYANDKQTKFSSMSLIALPMTMNIATWNHSVLPICLPLRNKKMD